MPASLVVKFILNDELRYAIATDISEKGMCIKSGHCLPRNAKFTLQIPMKERHVEIPAQVIYSEKTDGFYDVMGVRILKPANPYIKMVRNLRSAAGSS